MTKSLHCPSCKSLDVDTTIKTEEANKFSKIIFSGKVDYWTPVIWHKYKCNKCGYKWKNKITK